MDQPHINDCVNFYKKKKKKGRDGLNKITFNFFHFFPLAGLFQANKKKRFNQMEKGNSTHMELEILFKGFSNTTDT